MLAMVPYSLFHLWIETYSPVQSLFRVFQNDYNKSQELIVLIQRNNNVLDNHDLDLISLIDEKERLHLLGVAQ